ncbi:MAG: hypothetical protein M1818_002818 [Claussenomyces sp. TS43310]|nr:MAG: hypothetical protein M1818_002818 [Claussenomyces sp. TS43310]
MVLIASRPSLDAGSNLPATTPRDDFPPDVITSLRAALASPEGVSWLIGDRPVKHATYRAPSLDGSSHEIVLSVFRPRSSSSRARGRNRPRRPCIYWIHGGDMISGDRHCDVAPALDVLVDCDAVCVSVEYRLAPEHPHPTPLGDCYAGLVWLTGHAAAADLGIDPARIVVAGMAAGANLAAATALLCRDLGEPDLCAQFLAMPVMLDDRRPAPLGDNDAYPPPSSSGSRPAAPSVWDLYLDRSSGGASMAVSAPACARDLSRLPPARIDVGAADATRDQGVDYASRLWACGVATELHLWTGGGANATARVFSAPAQAGPVEMSRVGGIDWFKRILG